MRKLIPVLSVGLAATLVTAGAVTANAATQTTDPSGSVTITLSPEQVQNLCEKRLPRIQQRTTKLLDRINGGADVRGSVEWPRARATKERDAGRETSAQLPDERADRRAGRVDQLNEVKQWVTDFQNEHCEAK